MSWQMWGALASRTTHCALGWSVWWTHCCVRSSMRTMASQWVSLITCSVPARTPLPLLISALQRQEASQLCPSRDEHLLSHAGIWWDWSAGAMIKHAATGSSLPSPRCCLLKTGLNETWNEPGSCTPWEVFLHIHLYMCHCVKQCGPEVWFLSVNLAVPGFLTSGTKLSEGWVDLHCW